MHQIVLQLNVVMVISLPLSLIRPPSIKSMVIISILKVTTRVQSMSTFTQLVNLTHPLSFVVFLMRSRFNILRLLDSTCFVQTVSSLRSKQRMHFIVRWSSFLVLHHLSFSCLACSFGALPSVAILVWRARSTVDARRARHASAAQRDPSHGERERRMTTVPRT